MIVNYFQRSILILVASVTWATVAHAQGAKQQNNQGVPPAQATDPTTTTPLKPVVTFAVPRSFPPYHSIGKDGRVTGFAIDVAKAIESRIGIEFRYQIHENWASIFAALKDGGADALANIGISPKRAGFLSFSLPYDTLRISYFVRATDTSTKTSDQLANAKIGVVEVNKARALLEKQGHPNLAIYPSLSDAMFALISSQVDAIAYPENIALKAA
ncbi:MAG: transporter substrate-binding domain-containing protein, partial [Rhodospirillaceae bacterium]|nr:transporter substrate-binding domain-containing protein [Rhodospirillaceae bacterium]